jgi:trk system potassium uptake protein TrkA
MKKQVAVIGLGRFGLALASTLSKIGHDVLAIDEDPKKVQHASAQITHVVEADATSETVLTELGINNFDIGIVAIGADISGSVLSTILLKRLGVPYVVSKADDEIHGSILEKIGADMVVYPEHEIGTRVAHVISLLNIMDYMSLGTDYGIAKMVAPPYLVGEKLTDLGVGPGGKWEIAVLLIKREEDILVMPGKGEKFHAGDILVISGSDKMLENFVNEVRKVQKEKEQEEKVKERKKK